MGIRVFLLDDHEIVKAGMRALIESSDDLTVVGDASTAEEAVVRIGALRPDVAVLDVRLPDGSGVEVCREVRSKVPEVACVMLTSYADDEALMASVMAGASGYVLKQVGTMDLLNSIRKVAGGQSLLEPSLVEQVVERLRDGPKLDPRLSKLSSQEMRILKLISDGLTNRQIGEEMYLAEKTVKNYVSNVLSKLGMERRSQAASYAARLEERSTSGKLNDLRGT